MAASWLKRGSRLIHHWLRMRREPAAAPPRRSKKKAPPTPYRVHCACGQTLEGMRQVRRQILTCPKCKRRVFVLPTSPWPRLPKEGEVAETASPDAEATPPAPAADWKAWRQPLRTAVIAVLLVGLVVAAVLLLLDSSSNRTRSQYIRDQAELARQALERGVLADAHAALTLANRELQRLPRGFPQKEAADIHRLHRQVELVAVLSTPSLEELVAQARPMPMEKWTAQFTEKHSGKAVVFDAVLFPERDHHVRLDYELLVGGLECSIELNDIEEFGAWVSPNQDPQRWVFGLRLAKIDLKVTPDNHDGRWTVHFLPESMELITEPALLRSLDLSQQRDLRDVLTRQRKLVAWAPAQPVQQEDISPGTPGELVTKLLGPPDRVSRQILAGKFLEQRYYEKPQPCRIRLEQRRGADLRVVYRHLRLPNLQNIALYSE